MKFAVSATSEIYQEETEDVLKEKYGEILVKRNWVRDYSIDEEDVKNVIEIRDLEDLLKFQKEIDIELIIYRKPDDELPVIEIYDDYRE